MHLKKIFLFCAVCCVLNTAAQIPVSVAGNIYRIDSFPSKFVTARNIDIWLPQGYSAQKSYAVLYMHDGQMLYDSTTTWNKKAWDVDDVASNLMKHGSVKDFIVVGIWNGGTTRHSDYFPQKPYESLTKDQQAFVVKELQSAGRTKEIFHPVSDNYLKFLVTELKPFVDKHYSTKKDRQNTFIAGSSMGGLISMYAICEYPLVFGGAACLSTHWPGNFSMNNNPIPNAFFNYLKTNLPDPKTHQLYFDHGTATLDSMYPALQKKADEIILAKGYGPSNFLSKVFPGEEHSEIAWAKRVHLPLEFLLGDPAALSYASKEGNDGYQLVWSDEFNKDGRPDSTNWGYEHGFVRNQELQWYQPENAYCEDGLLVIEIRKEERDNPMFDENSREWNKQRRTIRYSSASLVSKNKQSWQYGRFELRAKVNIDAGLWPAWWTLGVGQTWPYNGEIDIMEYYSGMLLANIAFGGKDGKPEWFSKTYSTDSLGGRAWASKFHVWRMDWTEKQIALYCDNQLLNKVPLSALQNKDGSGFEPFKQPHYMLINLALGGKNGGNPNQSVYNNKYEVDWVRVYQLK